MHLSVQTHNVIKFGYDGTLWMWCFDVMAFYTDFKHLVYRMIKISALLQYKLGCKYNVSSSQRGEGGPKVHFSHEGKEKFIPSLS